MGCTSTRDQVYEFKQPQFSNRDINETKCDLQAAIYNISSQACGYEFGINVQNLDPFSSPNKQKVKQQAELQKFNHFMQVYKDIQNYLEASRIDQAYQLQQKLKLEYNELNFDILPELKADKKQEMLTLAQMVEGKYMQLKNFQKQLQAESWKETYVEDQQITVRYNHVQQESVVLAQTEVDVCLELMVATFGSFVRYHHFMKFAHFSKEIKKTNIFQRLGEIVYDIPFCPQTVSYVQEAVFDRISYDGSVIIGYESLFGNTKSQERFSYYPAFQNQPILDYSKIVCRMRPLSVNKTAISLLFRIKGKAEPIAEWVTDKLFKNIGVASTKKLIEKAKAFGEETDTEIFEGDDELYHHFHHLMKDNEKKVMD